jgi:hypothetical protein
MCVFIDGGSSEASSGGVSMNFPVSIQFIEISKNKQIAIFVFRTTVLNPGSTYNS